MIAFYNRSPAATEVCFYLLKQAQLPHHEAARTIHAFPGELDIILAGNGTRSRNTMIAIDRFIDIRRAVTATVGPTACIRWLLSPNRYLHERSPIERMGQSTMIWDLVLEIALSPNPMTSISHRNGQGTARPC